MDPMTQQTPPTTANTPSSGRAALWLGFILALLFFASSGYIAYRDATLVRSNTARVNHAYEVLLNVSDLLRLVRDAESGERGYVITGDESYLEPYNDAVVEIEATLRQLEILAAGDETLEKRVAEARANVATRLSELGNVITIRRRDGAEAARRRMLSHIGKKEMEDLQERVRKIEQEERARRLQMIGETTASVQSSIATNLLSASLGMALSVIVVYSLNRAVTARRRQEWLQRGQIGLATSITGEQSIEQLGANVLSFLAEYVGAQVGAFYAQSGRGYRRSATYGVRPDTPIPERFEEGEGLLGQAARGAKPVFINDLPKNYLALGSALGSGSPRHLTISPAISEGSVLAVFELGFLKEPSPRVVTLLAEASELIGVAVRSALYRSDLRELLEETQRQAEELQTQSEELRVSNEELEEQGRALRDSQTRLEHQQAELEQINAQLEDQTQELEVQRDSLALAQSDLRAKTEDLQRSSQYKSDFLANMSHELRTPLNSSLILAKLLADNPAENLTEEQVQFAKTIESSGNDLLALINDILDLSKIEAGHMEVHPTAVPLEWVAKDIEKIFTPISMQREVALVVEILPEAPRSLLTDRQRLDQILKNLLSNAFKFTDQGKVTLTMGRAENGEATFAVADTGIGISEEQQQVVFDAFRQADGNINRKYGGTGLGLSICRELARLLGGRIELRSAVGKGSVFTLRLPLEYAGPEASGSSAAPAVSAETRDAVAPAPSDAAAARAPVPAARPRSPGLHDDREALTVASRILLVVEDDRSFAKILYDVAGHLGFQCLIAETAEDALQLCQQYLPSAVVLDVGLPDHSGLSVLDRLKRDPRTRHIPVHVVSAGDYEQTALSLGAVGYMLKPVKRDQLEAAIKGLETRLVSTLRRILLVEDDAVQRKSVMKLLESRDVETVAVGTAAACLEKLKEETFDCMILDLTLPDSTGYALLETLSQGPDYSFPPVIVYTGRSLSDAEEQNLRRYSRTIIIKGAKSPERLLDEVTLFLHQVVSDLAPEKRRMLEKARNRDSVLEGRRILIVEDDIRNVYAVTNIFEPRGAIVQIARNGREALQALEAAQGDPSKRISLVLMDVMMPEMDGLTATREIRKRAEWAKLPIIMLTAKAMRDDQERCLASGANDYMAKPIDVEKLVSLVRVWMPR